MNIFRVFIQDLELRRLFCTVPHQLHSELDQRWLLSDCFQRQQLQQRHQPKGHPLELVRVLKASSVHRAPRAQFFVLWSFQSQVSPRIQSKILSHLLLLLLQESAGSQVRRLVSASQLQPAVRESEIMWPRLQDLVSSRSVGQVKPWIAFWTLQCLLSQALFFPGPCPPCPVMVMNSCYCTKSDSVSRRCSNKHWSCNKACNKLLGCKQHLCQTICHANECAPCTKQSIQFCKCKKQRKEVSCTTPVWQCEQVSWAHEVFLRSSFHHLKLISTTQICGKEYSCGFHKCQVVCHPSGQCGECPKSLKRSCPCGKSSTPSLITAIQVEIKILKLSFKSSRNLAPKIFRPVGTRARKLSTVVSTSVSADVILANATQ